MTNKEILRILATEEIRDQSELLAIIHKKGYEMTQSTLSRRLAKLGVQKKHGIYMPVNALESSIPGLIRRIDEAPPNILVIHTPPGHAQALAYQLDYISSNNPESISSLHQTEDKGMNEIVGAVAGDDTIIIVTRPEQLRILKQKIFDRWGL